jgi:hypothetical protein
MGVLHTATHGLIHVHHSLQLSRVGKDYKVDPVADLRPVCPNCHAVIHHRPEQPYSIEEVQSFLAKKIDHRKNNVTAVPRFVSGPDTPSQG